MRTFILRRVLLAFPLLLGVTTITFVLLKLTPGNFVDLLLQNPQNSPEMIAAMVHRFGLDRPWYVQYAIYLKNVCLHLDFGESFARHQPAFVVLREGLINTLVLAVAAAIITWGLAIPLGVWAAVRQYSWLDKGLSLLAFLWLSVPDVLSGLLLLFLAATTGLFPVGGMRSIDWESLDTAGKALDLLHHLVLPALVVGLVPLASRMRQMRANLLDVLRLDYVTTARAKGLDENTVVFKHAVRNALNPLITLFGFTLGALLSGALVAEIIFAWPGLGRITYEAITTKDQYVVLGGVQIAAAMLIAGNLVADILLAAADPRIAYD
jgi:peptide/nickel transport system permease protein